RQIWHCFGCSEGGDIFKFIMKIEGVEFGDALRILAEKAGVELKPLRPELKTERQSLYEICKLATRFYEKQLELGQIGKKAKDYLLSRGINEESIKKWHLGYAPNSRQALINFLSAKGYRIEEIEKAGLAVRTERGNIFDRFKGRIIFPVFDLNSQTIGFGARVFALKDVAKYINTPNTLLYDKSKVLYGMDKARLEARKKDFIILVEGYLDCILSHQTGFENTVALSGTALSFHHLKILQRYTNNLYFSFDMDLAGQEATKKGIFLAQQMGFGIKILSLPQGKDPADLIRQDPLLWKKSIEEAKSILDYFFELFLSQFDKEKIEEKKEIVNKMAPFILNIQNEIEMSFWLEKISKELKIKEQDLRKELSKIKFIKQEGREEIEISPPLVEKSRKEILEEKILSLILKEISFLDKIKPDELDYFSPLAREIIEGLKEKKENSFSSRAKDFYDYLLLKSEIEETEAFLLEKEFSFCKQEIEKMIARERLERLSQEIKIADEEKDEEKLKKLNEEFNFWAQKIK
ncbi:MAG: DNA primase, partial [Minisyncoccales bacterium]